VLRRPDRRSAAPRHPARGRRGGSAALDSRCALVVLLIDYRTSRLLT
jgi:hypothetical protein